MTQGIVEAEDCATPTSPITFPLLLLSFTMAVELVK